MKFSDRCSNQSLFLRDKSTILVTTYYFGFGQYIPSLVETIHYGSPTNVCTFYSNISRSKDIIKNSVYFDDRDFIMTKDASLHPENKMYNFVNDWTQDCRRWLLLQYINLGVNNTTESNNHRCNVCDSCMKYISNSEIGQETIDIRSIGGRIILLLFDALFEPSMTSVTKLLSCDYTNMNFQIGVVRETFIQVMTQCIKEAKESIDVTFDLLFLGIVPALRDAEYINEVAVESRNANKRSMYYIYSLTQKGIDSLLHDSPVHVLLNEIIHKFVQNRKTLNSKRLQHLLDCGYDLSSLSAKEQIHGEGPLIEHMVKFSMFFDSVHAQDEKENFSLLKNILTTWRTEEVNNMYEGIVPVESVMSTTALFKLLCIMTRASSISLQDIEDSGITIGDRESLVSSLANWLNTHLEMKNRNVNMNKGIHSKFKLIQHHPDAWKHNDNKDKTPSWKDVYDRFCGGESFESICENTYNSWRHSNGMKPSTLASKLFEAYNCGRSLDLITLSKSYPHPTVYEYSQMIFCYETTNIDVIEEKNPSWKTFLHPIIGDNKIGERWSRVMIWYQGLKRSGYQVDLNQIIDDDTDNNTAPEEGTMEA